MNKIHNDNAYKILIDDKEVSLEELADCVNSQNNNIDDWKLVITYIDTKYKIIKFNWF